MKKVHDHIVILFVFYVFFSADFITYNNDNYVRGKKLENDRAMFSKSEINTRIVFSYKVLLNTI